MKYQDFVKENFNSVSGTPSEKIKQLAQMWKSEKGGGDENFSRFGKGERINEINKPPSKQQFDDMDAGKVIAGKKIAGKVIAGKSVAGKSPAHPFRKFKLPNRFY